MPSQKIIEQALQKIFAGIDELKAQLPDKEFTIDGRLVGDIGEAIVQHDYDLTLYDGLVKDYDGETPCGEKVQIKATFKNSLTFKKVSDFYLGIKINKDGSYEEIFNGPGILIAKRYGHIKGFGDALLSFPNSVLKQISSEVPPRDKIVKR